MSSPYPTSTTSSALAGQLRRKWFINLSVSKQDRSLAAAATTVAVASSETTVATPVVTSNQLLSQVGFSDQQLRDEVKPEDDDRLLARRSWDIALQPIKQLPMNMIFAWMAGNSFSLMSIMIVVMLFMKPIQVSRASASHPLCSTRAVRFSPSFR